MSDETRGPVILSVHRRGLPEFERFVISDQFLRVWTGNGWSLDQNDAELFADRNKAVWTVRQLLMIDFEGKPVHRFRAPVYLDLYADERISVRDVQAWLIKVSKLLIDSPKHGNGPLQGTLGLCRIEWGKLEQLPSKETT